MRNTLEKMIIVAAICLLGACKTVPPKSAFSARQVAALTEANFKPVGANYELGLDERVLFEFDKSDLSAQAVTAVDRIADVLNGVGIEGAGVEGHTDATGSSQYNQALSERRAQVVKAEFVHAGMPEANIRAIGKGETQPIADNASEEGRQQNRRVVIIVTPEDAN